MFGWQLNYNYYFNLFPTSSIYFWHVPISLEYIQIVWCCIDYLRDLTGRITNMLSWFIVGPCVWTSGIMFRPYLSVYLICYDIWRSFYFNLNFQWITIVSTCQLLSFPLLAIWDLVIYIASSFSCITKFISLIWFALQAKSGCNTIYLLSPIYL